MNNVVFCGCSFVSGIGFNTDDPNLDFKESADLWVNLCHKNVTQLQNLNLINLSKGGASNTEIFEDSVSAISKYSDINFLICCWTSMPRYNFNIGFELYDTSTTMQDQAYLKSHRLNTETIPADYVQDLTNRLKALHHLHWEIVKLIKYINILSRLTEKFNIKLIHVNSICPWDKDFFKYEKNILPTDLTDFTQKEILNIKNRDDAEIIKLYTKQHQLYNELGGIQPQTWANLYNSLLSLQTDTNYDNLHPGINSNQDYYQILKQYIETNY